MSASENQWWEPFMKVRPSMSREELLLWILSTATIELQGLGGNVRYDDMSIAYTALDAGKGLEIRRQPFEDLDGNGVKSRPSGPSRFRPTRRTGLRRCSRG